MIHRVQIQWPHRPKGALETGSITVEQQRLPYFVSSFNITDKCSHKFPIVKDLTDGTFAAQHILRFIVLCWRSFFSFFSSKRNGRGSCSCGSWVCLLKLFLLFMIKAVKRSGGNSGALVLCNNRLQSLFEAYVRLHHWHVVTVSLLAC